MYCICSDAALIPAPQVNTQNLEKMRKVKTRHQRLYARVETAREELQRFLEDDDDMAKMCLTRKKELERMVSSGGGLSLLHAQHAPGMKMLGG